jgi:hypothetical protein
MPESDHQRDRKRLSKTKFDKIRKSFHELG